ncbi:MAG TPA: metalloregulator ArsR/SmtB family transcription factor [Flavobacterium sp.]|uniref:ArsR/SmtB family transcription factor n=1 Tax=unclassified Flavobacterium TaxID=196869 RepID=UPI000CB4077D|nr:MULTISPECIES: metalloregulator ArsR/SmtB family transcription factor [unclassified Flavobacterium]PKP16469.1 MAG: transcriptional regulator [Bacteroidetes bacterium HGW-Bacteroidetes-23]HBI01522.1 transcriptional regulator [Flavobacterium sp.]HRE76466.1 metalloregulator ArsR/SmtB family transcription factor [Flavobacterium sp.]
MGITKTTGFSQETNEMAEILKAIGHPARIAIIKLLSNMPSCVCGEIVEVLPLAQSTVSRHLAELKKVNLIKGNISGNNICYCLNQETWKKVKAFIKTISKPDGSPFDCC